MLISASLLSLLYVPTSALEQLHNNPWQDFHLAFLRHRQLTGKPSVALGFTWASITLYWYYLPYHLWLQMLLSTHTEPLFGKKKMGWALSCLSEMLKISVVLHQFQAQILSHFLHWWHGLGHFLWMNRLLSRMNKCLCDDRDLHKGFSQVGQSVTAAESWFSTQSNLERWACRSNGSQNHPQSDNSLCLRWLPPKD